MHFVPDPWSGPRGENVALVSNWLTKKFEPDNVLTMFLCSRETMQELSKIVICCNVESSYLLHASADYSCAAHKISYRATQCI